MTAPARTVTPIARLSRETMRECDLASRNAWGVTLHSPFESAERRSSYAHTCRSNDLAAESVPEGRLLPVSRINPHD